MDLKGKANQAFEVAWEEGREELTDFIVKKAVEVLGEERIRKLFDQKIFWTVIRPMISFLLPKGSKITDLGIDLSAELNDALKRYFRDDHEKEDSGKEKSVPKNSVTIRQALGLMESFTKANIFTKRLVDAKTLRSEDRQKILDSYFRKEDACGLIENLAECDQNIFEEMVKLIFNISEPVAPPEKVIIRAEIASGKYPNLEVYIQNLELWDSVNRTNKARALLDSFEADSFRGKIEPILQNLNSMTEETFKSYVDDLYTKSKHRSNDAIKKGFDVVKKRRNEPVKGRAFSSFLDAARQGWRNGRP